MWNAIKRLALGTGMLLLAAAVLLISDYQSRISARGRVLRVAVFQLASRPVLDETVRGVLEGLAHKGFIDRKSIYVQRYNAENDLPTANNIAKAILDGGFDLVITASTPCLQTMAAANREGKLIHVFGAVTDPAGSGVGISPTDPLKHPAHLVGIGTFQPVREAFLLARQMNPALKVGGLVWNPGEACAEACVRVARKTAAELGMTLVEAHVENSAGVQEAAASVVARGADALFIGGDNTVEMAIESVAKAARQGRVPVFGYAPGHVEKGALAGLGADYVQVGQVEGELAADILKGRNPRTVRIENVLPRTLSLNLGALAGLRGAWRIPPDVLASAAWMIDEQGKRIERKARPAAAPARKWKIDLIELVESPAIDESRRGVVAGLHEAGLVEGRDYEVRIRNAQGDMALLNNMVDAAVTAQADMIYTITTPALQVAMNKVHDRPVLFTLAVDPLLVGDRGTHGQHRANVAGVYDRSPFEDMMKLIRECLPGARRMGTLFTPGEPNSVNFRAEMEKAARSAGLDLVALPSNSPAEVNDSALALTARGLDAVCQINDNLHDAAFPSIAAAARRRHVPVFAFSTGLIARGATVVLANDHFDEARESARMAARVMRGESPAGIPYEGVRRTRLLVNPEAAREAGMRLPEAVLARAEKRPPQR
jgi:ABC-type uncharacterized transport system substrate-binding protein